MKISCFGEKGTIVLEHSGLVTIEEVVNRNELIRMVERYWSTHKIGLIYLDIVNFSEIEHKYGQQICDQILFLLEGFFVEIRKSHPSIFHYERMGDDFYLYVLLGKNDERFYLELALKELSMKLTHMIKKEINDNSFELKEKIDFHIGYTQLYPNAIQSTESIIYNAIKTVIKQAKEIHQDYLDNNRKEFHQILLNKQFSIHYQPIVSLSQGNILAFEALTRGPMNSYFQYPDQLFKFAETEGLLYQLEKVTREQAIQNGCGFIEPHQKLFININSKVIYDPFFTPGYTIELLEKYRLSPKNIVFEITERSAIQDFSAFRKVLEHYRNQDFQIAIDDAGAGYSSLQAISELKPDYIKIDRSLIQNIDQNKVKENLLETFVNISRKMNSKVIAEGIETMEELSKVTRLGVHFGQGYFLARPNYPPNLISQKASICIEKNKRIENIDNISNMKIEQITSPVKVFDYQAPLSKVIQYFSESLNDQGIVITDKGKPIGIVMREKLNQQLIKPYAVSLFWKRPIHLLMDSNPLLVDSSLAIDVVAQMAITREDEKMYDYVIVVKNNQLLGTVSVKNILDFLANVKMEMVRQANPLTGLPGNQQIKKELITRLSSESSFALIYADINHFKWFNDRYGFQRGDQVIKHLAEILQEVILEKGSETDFIGHIGGDDFVIISLSDNAINISNEIIERFDKEIIRFYDQIEDLFLPIVNRSGQLVPSRGVGLSLALLDIQCPKSLSIDQISRISANVKKKAKEEKKSNVTYFNLNKA